MKTRSNNRRTGSVVPMTAVCVTSLFAMVALAIDVGIMAVARTQCQNAADASAMAGVRSLNGDESAGFGYANTPTNAVSAATANSILNKNVQGNPNENWSTSDATLKAQIHPNDHTYKTGNVTVEIGSYAYTYNDSNPAQEKFQLSIPRASAGEPYSAVRTTVDYSGSTSFARVFGISGFSTRTRATAIHRPRDVVIIVDLSGSMRFQSLPGGRTWGARSFSLNPEAVFPQFGHYSDIAGAALQGTSAVGSGGGEFYDLCNISTDSDAGPHVIADFRKSAALGNAFSRAPDTQNTVPGGDDYKKQLADPTLYAATVEEITGTNTYDTAWETTGYGEAFAGFTEGPGYWGKTFFIWPPDPRNATQTPPSSLTDTAYAFWHNNGAKDWRQRFFVKVNITDGDVPSWLDDNTILYDNDNYFKTPGTVTRTGSVEWTYRINYAAILYWLGTVGSPGRVNPFPGSLWGGRISYYTTIPDPTDATGAALNNRFWTETPLADRNERFWKEYIDFVLGFESWGGGSYSRIDGKIGNGPIYAWGDHAGQLKSRQVQSGEVSSGYASGYSGSIDLRNLSQRPNVSESVKFAGAGASYPIASVTAWDGGAGTATVVLSTALTSAVTSGASVSIQSKEYMDYRDNPYRPRHQLWFGPMTMVDFLGNYNTGRLWWPGNVHEAQGWACKMGVQTAIRDIKNNHPSDFLSLVYFSNPRYSNGDTSGQHNRAVVSMGQKYQKLIDSLWFPVSTVSGTKTEINCYDSDMTEVPRARGATAPGMGFMLAYNQLSSNISNLRLYSTVRGDAGGLGRKGANKLIIFETDGSPNTGATSTLVSSGTDSYYPIRVKNPGDINDALNVEWPSRPGFSTSDVYDVVSQISAMETANPPGFSTPRKPVQIHSIAFGYLFDPANAGGTQTNALDFLQEIQYRGKVQSDPSLPLEEYKRIYGTYQQRQDKLAQAFTNIMQSGVQVSLIE